MSAQALHSLMVERIKEVLIALKDGIGADATAVFDDDRGTIYLCGEESAAAFWEGLQELACLRTDWLAWYRELRVEKRLCTTCSCSLVHTIHAFLLHERWALLVISSGHLPSTSESVMISAAKVLTGLLPNRRTKVEPPGGGGSGGGGGPDEGRVGIPLWWARKVRA